MSYTPPNADNVQFDFTDSGYTPPSADNISFQFASAAVDRTVVAPTALARSSSLVGASLAISQGVLSLSRSHYLSAEEIIAIVSNDSLAKARGSINTQLDIVAILPSGMAKSRYTGAAAGPPSLLVGIGALAKSRHYVWLEPFTNNTSWDDRRPCAVTFDGMTGFDMGPDDWWDIESSLYARPWKVKAYGGNTWVARAKEDWTGWDLDWYREWFQLPDGQQGGEFDLTFDQNARPFVCWEHEGEIWIRYYDPVEEAMTTRYVCDGRTPVAKLDERRDRLAPISDIMLFYINDAAERVEYRMQRDRYYTAYPTNLSDIWMQPDKTHDIGGNEEGLDGALKYGSPTDEGDYYRFDGTDDGLYWDRWVDLHVDSGVQVFFRARNKARSSYQCLWSSGGHGVAIGFNGVGDVGIWDGDNNITIAAEHVPEDTWLYIECWKNGVRLSNTNGDVIAEASGSVNMAVDFLSDPYPLTGIMPEAAHLESVGFSYKYSLFTGGDPSEDGTGDFFDGDVDHVKIGSSYAHYITSNMYLELLYKSPNLRLYLFFSIYDPVAATYSVGYWHSAPYPYVMDNAEKTFTEQITSGVIKQTYINQDISTESVQVVQEQLLSGTVRESIIIVVIDEADFDVQENLLSGSLRVSILETETEMETTDISEAIQSGATRNTILLDTISVEEMSLVTESILSGSKETTG